MKRFLSILLAVAMALSACTACAAEAAFQKFSYYFFGTFDTIITIVGYAQTEDEFNGFAQQAESEMRRYHQIFDLYNAYDGVHNLHEVNRLAGTGAVKAEPELIDLLVLVQQWHEQYGTAANPAMGSVLSLWHDARTAGTYLPDETALEAASVHTSYQDVIIDREKQTVFFADPSIQLDLGAVAKGYAAQLVADQLRAAGLSSFIVNAGGNVVCGGAPLDGRECWKVAVEDLDGVSTRMILGTTNMAIVTSGDYQRYYEVDGVRYHHLIDPETLAPAAHMRAVTIVYPDSGLADFLSTTAFLLPYEQSRQLIDGIAEAEALWTLNDGTEIMTDGFEALIARAQN